MLPCRQAHENVMYVSYAHYLLTYNIKREIGTLSVSFQNRTILIAAHMFESLSVCSPTTRLYIGAGQVVHACNPKFDVYFTN